MDINRVVIPPVLLGDSLPSLSLVYDSYHQVLRPEKGLM